jgi:pimeloyl-ACP methyl ester carboxylesterase
MRVCLIGFTALALCGAAAGAVAQQAQPAAMSEAPVRIEGTLPDGTSWAMLKPAQWNGTMIVDLDGAGFGAMRAPGVPRVAGPPQPGPFVVWLLSQGYAYGGTMREPVGYDFPKAVGNLLEVRRLATAQWGAPKRTIVSGGSRGGFVVRKALELHPEVFDGAFTNSGGGAGEIAVLNRQLHAPFVLKTLVDPTSPATLVNIRLEPEMAAMGALLDKAKATPQGRARLALATAVQQFALWSVRDSARPAATDYDAQLDQIVQSFMFAAALPVRAGVEKVAGGNVSWNTGVDYGALLDRSGRRPMVEALYRKAGLSLANDLKALAKAPRVSADPAAVRKAEPLMTYTGKIADPLVQVDNDDPVDPASDKLAYAKTLERAGTRDLFKLIWTDGPGHGGQTNLDRAVGFTVLMRRVDTGRWPDTSLAALRALGDEVARSSPVDLGKLALFEPSKIAQPVATWDSSNWGSYRP